MSSTTLFLPKKINVGYDSRNDTYTGKLAYVIYFDEKGVLRKQKSWDGWRKKELGNDEFDNVPTSGFVLNKKVGGYKSYWNIRQTMIRVYDPRGFEFEITPANLLYILENATSTKGKGLEGEFVYGWEGSELVLVPTDSPDYQDLVKINELRHAQDYVKAKDLKIGATYLSKDNKELIYMGKFDEYGWGGKKDKKSFYFAKRINGQAYFETMQSISGKLVAVVSEECVEDYADIFYKLEGTTTYSPIDHSLDEFVSYTLEEFLRKSTERTYGTWFDCFNYQRVSIHIDKNYKEDSYYVRGNDRVTVQKQRSWGYGNYSDWEYPKFVESATLEEIFESQRPMWRKVYLANGRLYQEGK